MQIKVYVIDVRVPRWARRAAIYGGVPAAVMLGASALVWADVTLPHTFTAGETLTAANLNASFEALRDAINDPDPPCPRGYTYDGSSPPYVVCTRGADEVVKVGTGGSAFWVDRYEASIWSGPDGTGNQQSYPYPATFPPNGKVTSSANLLYAASRPGVAPANAATWFQAALACRASGKRLATNEEWQIAVTGTNDPASPSDGVNGACLTDSAVVRNTGSGDQCRSLWGAEDMIGNLAEWVSEWLGSPGVETTTAVWPDSGDEYGDDLVVGITSSAYANGSGFVAGLPSVVFRGGCRNWGVEAGAWAVSAFFSPAAWDPTVGFRCVIPRA
jgi:hypothetical protein